MMNQPKKQSNKKRPDYLVIIVSLIIMIGVFFFIRTSLNPVKSVSVKTFEEMIDHENVERYEWYEISNKLVTVTGELKEGADPSLYNLGKGTKFTLEITFNKIEKLDEIATGNGVLVVPYKKSDVSFFSVLLSLLPIIISGFLIFIIFKNVSNQNNKAMDFSKNRATISKNKSITFDDVAGAVEEKEELAEVVDFLKNPKRYSDMGARIPKGILLAGAPGTGKTLLARAVAGEANVPFFTISGSDFVEMFVGVGASRVRNLFKAAKESAPCIIFIDEIDAVGRQRGAGLGGGNDEREQTLNQLLVEMDGFSDNQGIIIIAATNRPDVLDPALLRPGRFDRQITIDLPDVRGRAAILKVHARNKKIDPDVNFKNLAQRIPGFSGADIENLLNEAALLAARSSRTVIQEKDLDEAMDRVRMGPAKKSRKYNEQEKSVVAYHEAGHAVIGIKLEHASVVQKVTIIPRGNAGGYNLMMPSEETFLQTKASLLHTITGYLGGRVAEEIQFDSVTTGAYNDFEMATKIARAMVTEYGMSDLGPIQYESRGQNVFLGRDYLNEKNFSDHVAQEIDKEVRKIISRCFDEARTIIKENKVLLDTIADYLIKVETLTKSDIDEIVETGKLAWYEKDIKDEIVVVEEEKVTETVVEETTIEVTTEDTKKQDNDEN
ncbi:MAG TPA: ATP-dependent zinc metalloprotease FtsH [Haploplasma sp.]|nr:ATP-dependent zinc metalloprotease FtsH [Haploplasma sp.]